MRSQFHTSIPAVQALATILVGQFDNAQQTAADPDFIPVRYDNCVIRLVDSPFGADAITIFAEQTARTPAKSFARRRLMVVHPTADQTQIEVEFHTFKQDDRFADLAAQQRSPRRPTESDLEAWATIAATDLDVYECSLYFVPQGELFIGGTTTGGCIHHYAGAERLIIQARLAPGELSVWERWYDGNGQQVAGSPKGPYIYCA